MPFNPYSCSKKSATSPAQGRMSLTKTAPPLVYARCGKCGGMTCTRHTFDLLSDGWSLELPEVLGEGLTIRGTCPNCRRNQLPLPVTVRCGRCGEWRVSYDLAALIARGWVLGDKQGKPVCPAHKLRPGVKVGGVGKSKCPRKRREHKARRPE